MLPEQLQEQIYMLKMCGLGAAVDEDVIKENKEKFYEIWFEKVVHDALKSRWGIKKTKWHDQELIMAFMSSESSFSECRLPSCEFGSSLSEDPAW